MWQRVYLQRLKRDLELWIERGWVTPQNAEAILVSASGEAAMRRVPQLLALLGAVLIGFAAMSFVAANWNELSKLAKLLLLVGAMLAAYGAAFALDRRGHPAFAQAAIVGGLALFGANIALIAQIYHVSSSDPRWILLWCLAALASAWALPSRPALALSFLLASLWSSWSPPIEGHAHWAFFLPWAAALGLAIRLSWIPGFHLAILTAYVWAALNAEPLAANLHCGRGEIAALYILISLALWLLAVRTSERSSRFGSVIEGYGIVVSFALLWVLQAMPPASNGSVRWLALAFAATAAIGALGLGETRRGRLTNRDAAGIGVLAVGALLYSPLALAIPSAIPWIYAALFLALSAWLVAYGTNRKSRFALNAGFAAFAAEALYIYFETLGSLLGTAAFFALGGVVLIAGSLLLARVRKRVVDAVDKGGEQ